MAKRVFFSFHYKDVASFRANVVRNHWLTKDDRQEAGYFDASIWEEAQKTSDLALKRLINKAVSGTSTTCVLVGSQTYARRWVRYEIMKGVEKGNHLLAVHINQIKDKFGNTSTRGPNPLNYLGLVYSEDGKRVKPIEKSNGSWITYRDLPGWTLQSTAPPQHLWGKAVTLTDLGYRIYCWIDHDGYKSFANWVG